MSAMDNEAMIEKNIQTGDLTSGGQLNPLQQSQFITLVKKFSVLLPQVRFVRMPRPMMDIDKLWVGEPVTESVDEATDTGNLSKAKFQRITLAVKKVRSAWNITTEVLQGNIEQNDFEQTVMNTFIERIATDLEDLAINGDTTLVGTTPRDRLLRRLDGFLKITDDAHIFDVGGVSIQKGIFSAMKRRMPKQYKNDPGLRWLLGDGLAVDWADVVSDRGTILGDAALQGAEMSPLGTPMIRIPLIPDDLPITVSMATAAETLGGEYGPFIINSTNDTLIIDVDGNGNVTVTLPHGTLDCVEVAKAINDALVATPAYGLAYADFARDNREGLLYLQSPTDGVASSITLQPVPVGSQAYTVLGLLGTPTVGAPNWPLAPVTYNGTNAGTYTTVNEGSVMLLTNPKNLVWGILDGTRIFTDFNKNTDQVESIVYNQVDNAIENRDAIVKATNIRRRTLTV